MLTGLSVQTMAQTDPGTTNLTHKWTFEDATYNSTTTTVNDVVGTVGGVLSGGATVSGGALNTTAGGIVTFDPAALAINTYTELTVEAWFTSSAGVNSDSYRFLYYFGNSDGNGNHFTGITPVRGGDGGYSRAMIDTGTGTMYVNSTQYDDGLLHHVVCVIDATTLSYYFDGILLNSTPVGTASLANVGNQFAYLCRGGWNDPSWRGTINEFSIYNKALTLDNVKYLYNLHKIDIAATNPGTANLKHQWTFDGGNANDVVGTVNGTLNGGAVITNKALDLSNDGYLDLDATALAVNTYPELTVESWFTATAGANNGYRFLWFLGNSDGGGNHFVGYTPNRGQDIGPIGKFLLADNAGGETGEVAVKTPQYNDSRQHHVVNTLTSTTLSTYIDGVLTGTASIGANTIAAISLQHAYLGKGGWPDPNWKGQIQKFSMYDKALSAGDVKYLYNLGAEAGITNAVNQVGNLNKKIYVSNNQIVAEFESSSVVPAQVAIYSIQGALLSNKMFTCNAGLNRIAATANYPAGIYMVRLTVDGETSYTKIVK